MAKVQASERIRLSDGDEMTMAEAIDGGRVTLRPELVRGRNGGDPRTVYVAVETSGDLCWEIGKMLYDSRKAKARGEKFRPFA